MKDIDRKLMFCPCNRVTNGDIIDSIEAGAKTYRDVMMDTNAGVGCGRCLAYLEVFVRDYVKDKESSGESN